jgi:hypothetical protein
MSQLYAIPVVKEFVDEREMLEYEKENEIEHSELFQETLSDGTQNPKITATYHPQLSLHLEDKEGKMVEGKESKFFQIGHKKGQIKPQQLKWKGIFKIIPRSIVDSSQTLARATKMELTNMLIPVLSSPNPNAMQLLAKIAKQMVKLVEEDPVDWLPDTWMQFLEQPPQPAQPQGAPGMPPGPPGMPVGAPGVGGMGNPAMTGNMGGGQGPTPTAPTAVPQGEVSGGQPNLGGLGKIFEKRV